MDPRMTAPRWPLSGRGGPHRGGTGAASSLAGPEPIGGDPVAYRMHWDMSYKSWDEFPIPQKWFATGEAIAHLRYLEEQGTIHREPGDGKILYTRSE